MAVATQSALPLRIGEVAKQASVAVGALRYYEELGLVSSQRGKNGYRYYDSAAIHQVQFIKKAQALGFSLQDVKEVLGVYQQGEAPCELVRSRLQEKIDHLANQIQQMNAFKGDLETYRDRWANTSPPSEAGDICPLIETVPLAEDGKAIGIVS